MRYLFRIALPILGLLVVLLIPFLAFGAQFELWAERWRQQPPGPAATFGLMVGLLSTDILLPIPSSAVSTLAGGELGWQLGTAASWLGMTLGAILGFVLARRWGRGFAAWMSSDEDLERMQHATRRYGGAALVLARGVPLLAEASVLLFGAHGMAWRQFLPPILLSNLGIALAYSVFGDIARQHEWLPLALGVAVGLPVLLAVVMRRWLPEPDAESTSRPD
ncbi:MAG: VTT domain-containing protein [Planctomycetales bacterium]|nr:VTT domain-containing protein [Planctomycetales bacterium]